jgi:hypothetical protein
MVRPMNLQAEMAMQQARTVIRMGAAEWSATVATSSGPIYFDLSRMSKDERREFHREFMNAYRKINPYKPRQRKTS